MINFSYGYILKVSVVTHIRIDKGTHLYNLSKCDKNICMILHKLEKGVTQLIKFLCYNRN